LPLEEESLNTLGPKDIGLEDLFEELFPPIDDHLVAFVNNVGGNPHQLLILLNQTLGSLPLTKNLRM
jgi:hypothetical protein